MGVFDKKRYEFSTVTTRNGDSGKSSNYDGEYYSKDDILFETLGNLDELSSQIGIIKHLIKDHNFFSGMEKIQLWLQYGGSLVATNPRFNTNGEPVNTNYIKLTKITQQDIDSLEAWMKKTLDTGIVIENGFILPGKTPESAQVDMARAICRRAERSLVRYMVAKQGERYDLKYLSMLLNRLSDQLFITGRWIEQKKGVV